MDKYGSNPLGSKDIPNLLLMVPKRLEHVSQLWDGVILNVVAKLV